MYEGDRLKSYNGEVCAYNNLGNPETYRGKAATWKYGKLLAEYNGVTFAYDMEGKRSGKGSISFVYDDGGNLIIQSNGLEFIYDHTGLCGLRYNDTEYFYRKDAQGNIAALLDKTGAVVVYYEYDAWGNHAVLGADGKKMTDVNHIGNLNPFRFILNGSDA